MSYTITKSNGQTLITLQDGTLDKTKTSITLVGKNYPGYGTTLNQNLVQMLENFANSTAPTNPLVGQLWYNTATGRLNVYSGSGFKATSATVLAASQPTTNANGDFWFKSDTGQLYVYNGTTFSLIGPTVSSSDIFAANVDVSDTLTAVNANISGVLTVGAGGSITTTSLSITDIDSSRVIYTTTGGELTGISSFTFSDSTLTVTVPNVTASGTVETNKISVGAGTITAPSITRTGDTNTGLYFPAAETVVTVTNGLERFYVGSSGTITAATGAGANFGIGTTTPGSKLEVKGEFRLAGSSSGYIGIQSPAAPTSVTYTLPTSDGPSGAVLKTNGSGVMSWNINPGYSGSVGYVGSASTVAGPQGPQGYTGSAIVGYTGSAGGGGGGGGYTGSEGPIGYTGSAGGGGGGGGYTGSIGFAGSLGFVGSHGYTGSIGYTGSSGTVSSLTNDTSSAVDRYVTFVNSSVSPSWYISDTKLIYRPSNGTLTATDFAATSDIRYKDITGPLTNALAKVNTLRGVHYKWNDTARINGIQDTSDQIGVIAQEVQQILPQAVETHQGMLAVKYDKLVPLLIEAVKELTNKVSSLEQQLANKL